jgi:endonuclease-3
MNRIPACIGAEEAALTEVGSRTRDPFQVLVSCLLSLRTRDETTAAASRRLFRRAKTPRTLLGLSPVEIEEAIFPVGFYKTKARRILEICDRLLKEHGGRVPEDMEALRALPGVGPKTANIVWVYGFRRPGLPIDTHCHRIPNRLGWVRTKTPEETERVLRRELPKKYWMVFNDYFVRFGQTICKPVGPRCHACGIEPFCRKEGVRKVREQAARGPKRKGN